MEDIAIIGAGRIGEFIAGILSKSYNVYIIDAKPTKCSDIDIPAFQCDATKRDNLQKKLESADLVVSAVPGKVGYTVLKNIIKCGHSVVDLSFSEDDPLQLESLAREHDVTAIVDAGIAPGLSNFVGGYYDRNDSLRSFHCYVGGLPLKRSLPWEYRAPFSPDDVIEEYTRPARIREEGQLTEKPALSDYQRIETEQLGTLEAFNTDGLRTLLETLHCPNLKEQTLRYPGHCRKVKLLRDIGLLRDSPIEIQDKSFSPRALTAHLLKEQWQMKPGDRDCTYMRIDLELSRQKRRFELFDRYNTEKNHTSMARCTGYSCIKFVEWYMEGAIDQPGIVTPEQVGANPEFYKPMLDYLRSKGMHIKDRNIE